MVKENSMVQRRLVLLAGTALVAACSTTPDAAQASAKRREIDVQVDGALGQLFTNAPGARQMASNSEGFLVFPEVFTAGLLVGGSHGTGALRKGANSLGYYSVSSGSVGLLAGAQTRTLFVFFMTPAGLARFQQSDGWTIGGDASVAVMDAGAMGRLDKGAGPAIIGLVRNQQGLMANLSLDGTKISRLQI
jgi:lipid-binding SYLF domain-containing protein